MSLTADSPLAFDRVGWQTENTLRLHVAPRRSAITCSR